MHRLRRFAWKARSNAALLTAAAHAFFVLLLWLESRLPLRAPGPVREIVSIPITLAPLVDPGASRARDAVIVPEPATRPPRPVTPAAPAAPVPAPAPQSTPRPATAITLPPPGEAPTAPRIDWYAESGSQAARYAEAIEAPPPVAVRTVQKMREPCRPRESSFKFEKQRNRTGGSAALTLGWEEPEPDAHLFDDMMAGRRSKSSVPDPHVCD